jgi:hypothetical protein
MVQEPDFESMKQTNVYAMEYWSVRDLAPLQKGGVKPLWFIQGIEARSLSQERRGCLCGLQPTSVRCPKEPED